MSYFNELVELVFFFPFHDPFLPPGLYANGVYLLGTPELLLINPPKICSLR